MKMLREMILKDYVEAIINGTFDQSFYAYISARTVVDNSLKDERLPRRDFRHLKLTGILSSRNISLEQVSENCAVANFQEYQFCHSQFIGVNLLLMDFYRCRLFNIDLRSAFNFNPYRFVGTDGLDTIKNAGRLPTITNNINERLSSIYVNENFIDVKMELALMFDREILSEHIIDESNCEKIAFEIMENWESIRNQTLLNALKDELTSLSSNENLQYDISSNNNKYGSTSLDPPFSIIINTTTARIDGPVKKIDMKVAPLSTHKNGYSNSSLEEKANNLAISNQLMVDSVSQSTKQENKKEGQEANLKSCTTNSNNFLEDCRSIKEKEIKSEEAPLQQEIQSTRTAVTIDKAINTHLGSELNTSINVKSTAEGAEKVVKPVNSIAVAHEKCAEKLRQAALVKDETMKDSSTNLSLYIKETENLHYGKKVVIKTNLEEITTPIVVASEQKQDGSISPAQLATQQKGSLFSNPPVPSSTSKRSLPMSKTAKKKLVEEAYKLFHEEYVQADIEQNEQLQQWEKLLLEYNQKDGTLDATQVTEVNAISKFLKGEIESTFDQSLLPLTKSARKKLVEEAYKLLHEEYDQTDINQYDQLQEWEKTLTSYKQNTNHLNDQQVAEVRSINDLLREESEKQLTYLKAL